MARICIIYEVFFAPVFLLFAVDFRGFFASFGLQFLVCVIF